MTITEKQAIEQKAAELANNRGLVALHFILRGTDSRPVIELVLDGPTAVNLDDCEVVHKQLLEFIDNTINKAIDYRLDVLSPGIDEPLKYDYQLDRSVNKPVSVSYLDDTKNLTKIGTLVGYSESEVIIAESKQLKGQARKIGEELRVPRSAISVIKQVALIK